MQDKMTENRINKKILEEAAEYYLSLQDDSMSGPELKAWQAWYMRSEDHQLAFRRLETLWGVLEAVSANDFAPESVTAASVPKKNMEPTPEAMAGSSIIGLVTRDLPKTPRKRPATQWYAGIAASFAAALVATVLVLSPMGDPDPQDETAYFTEMGEQRVVNLADGSIVELGPDSEVLVGYTAAERGLTLVRGQAIFTVSKNPNRPFVVRAGSGSVTAIGTVFNIRRLADDVRVRVLEGTVAVRPQSAGTLGTTAGVASVKPVALVTAGNQTLYSGAGSMTPVEIVDVHADLAWRVGVLTMVNRELSDVIQELNRFVESEIAIGDDAVGKFHFTGTVYPDKMDEWLEGLTEGYPVKVVHVGARTILMLDEATGSR